jgi:hypothetical protein
MLAKGSVRGRDLKGRASCGRALYAREDETAVEGDVTDNETREAWMVFAVDAYKRSTGFAMADSNCVNWGQAGRKVQDRTHKDHSGPRNEGRAVARLCE